MNPTLSSILPIFCWLHPYFVFPINMGNLATSISPPRCGSVAIHRTQGFVPHGTRVPSRHGPKFATWNGATERLVHCDGCVLLIYSMWMYVIVTPCYSQVVDIDDIAMQWWTCQRIENKWEKKNTAIETMYIINPIPLILNRIWAPNCTNPTPNHCFWRVWNIWGNRLIRIYPLAYACNNTPAMWGERDDEVFGAIPVQCQSCALWVELAICPQSQTWGQKSNNDQDELGCILNWRQIQAIPYYYIWLLYHFSSTVEESWI
jgi:hypothetical protein